LRGEIAFLEADEAGTSFWRFWGILALGHH